jgi:hypothetical protein
MKPFWATKPFQVRLKEPLGKPECPYAYRWVLIFLGYSIRIHHFLRSDDKRYLHDHGWWFLTFILSGSYVDVNEHERDELKRFQFRYRPAMHKHYVEVPVGGCWTILITGRPSRNWGFWVDGKLKRPLKYFHKFGHPACADQ